MVVTLGLFNTVSLALNTAEQLVFPGGGHCYFELLNTGTGNVYVSNLNSVGANATSFKLATGQTMPSIPVWGPTGIWVYADAAGPLSVVVVPRS